MGDLQECRRRKVEVIHPDSEAFPARAHAMAWKIHESANVSANNDMVCFSTKCNLGVVVRFRAQTRKCMDQTKRGVDQVKKSYQIIASTRGSLLFLDAVFQSVQRLEYVA